MLVSAAARRTTTLFSARDTRGWSVVCYVVIFGCDGHQLAGFIGARLVIVNHITVVRSACLLSQFGCTLEGTPRLIAASFVSDRRRAPPSPLSSLDGRAAEHARTDGSAAEAPSAPHGQRRVALRRGAFISFLVVAPERLLFM